MSSDAFLGVIQSENIFKDERNESVLDKSSENPNNDSKIEKGKGKKDEPPVTAAAEAPRNTSIR